MGCDKLKPKELADKHLGEYKQKNGNILAKYCPFCKGGQHNDKWTFGVNIENGAYNCFRGKCGEQGSFKELLEHFNEKYEGQEKYKQNNYKKPKVETTDLSDKVLEYLKLREFSVGTLNKLDIKEKDGNIAFEYFQDGEKVLIKYRTAAKKKKYWQEGGGKPVLWNMRNCNTDKALVITEGEMDTTAIVEAGYDNVVSVPFGSSNLDWIEQCWDFLDSFEEIIIWPDNDKPGKEMKEKVVSRLGKWRCKYVDVVHKDANEMLYKEGKKAVKQAIYNAEDVPIDRVINLADVEPLDLAKIDSCKSSIGQLNRLLGGYMMGYISVWTGKNGSGKSTFLGQEMIQAVEEGYGVGAYSGELQPSLFQYWINLQAAGPDNFKLKHHSIKDEMTPYVPKDIKEKITDWYDKRLFYYDISDTTKPEKILETFENLYRKYGIKTFYIDSLMTIEYGGNKAEYYHRQSEFVTKCKNFASRLGIHIHLVAHPKKTPGRLKKEDIAGLYEITSKADNVMVMHRVNEDNKKDFQKDLRDCDNVIDVLKSRIYGWQKVSIGLGFEENTKRVYSINNSDKKFRKYGWE